MKWKYDFHRSQGTYYVIEKVRTLFILEGRKHSLMKVNSKWGHLVHRMLELVFIFFVKMLIRVKILLFRREAFELCHQWRKRTLCIMEKLNDLEKILALKVFTRRNVIFLEKQNILCKSRITEILLFWKICYSDGRI